MMQICTQTPVFYHFSLAGFPVNNCIKKPTNQTQTQVKNRTSLAENNCAQYKIPQFSHSVGQSLKELNAIFSSLAAPFQPVCSGVK